MPRTPHLNKIKLTLLGVFGAGVVATTIGKGRLKVMKIRRIKSNLSHLMAKVLRAYKNKKPVFTQFYTSEFQ